MLKVMLVDNEAAIRKGLIHCIRWEALNCTVTAQAQDGIDALEQIPTAMPDIVISDIRMPGMDGLELARCLNESYPQIKVIILTGFPDFSYAQRAIAYRVVDFVLKPTTVESLTQAIEKAKAHIAEERNHQELAMELVNQSEQNVRLQRSMLLNDLIRRVELSHLYVLSRMTQLGLDLRSYFVLRLDVSPLDETGAPQIDPSGFSFHLHEVQSVLHDCLSEYNIHFIPCGEQSCYAVVCAPESAPIHERCLETASILGSVPRFSLCIGISRHSIDPIYLANAAEEADKAAQFASYSPDHPVICYEQMPEIPPEALERVFSDLKLLKSSIENQNRAASHDIIMRLFTFIRENKLPVDTVRNICVYIHQFCISLLFLSDSSSISDGGLPALKHLLEDASVDSLEESMLTFVEQMFDRAGADTTDAGSVIHAVKAYIDTHCADDLSLENLAKQVFLSPSYLSKLFKRETGENLSLYVQNVRVERAKLLLLTTELKTYEVAERVGIPDPVYFSRIFKKSTGYRPKEFRHSTG